MEGFIEITNSGNNVRSGYTMSTLYANGDAIDDVNSTPFADWSNQEGDQTGDQGLVLLPESSSLLFTAL